MIHYAESVAQYSPSGPNLRALVGTPGDAVILGGHYNPGDGGGGQFYWSNSPASDNGGTVINATVGATSAGWRRIWTGAINVQWFGAIPTVIPDCNPAIDAALALARSVQYHAPIYFPAGEYNTRRPIVIPRGPQGTGWHIYGDGAGVTQILFAATEEQDGQPLMTFDEQGFEVYGFRLHGLSLVRLRPGPVFVYRPLEVGGPELLAMRHSTIRDVWVLSNEQPFAPGFPGYAGGAALLLDGVRDCLIENVQVDGCEVGLLLKDSARCTLSSVQACLQMAQGSRHGMVIEGGGGHVLTNSVFGPMGSNTYPGHALTLRTSTLPGRELIGPLQCTFVNAQFEGRHTADAIRIEAGGELSFTNYSPPGHGPATHKQRGIYVGPIVRHVDFHGGWANNYTGGPNGSVAIEVENGASDVRFHNVGISQPHSYGEVRLPNPRDPGFASRNVGGSFNFGVGPPHLISGTVEVGTSVVHGFI